MQSADASLEKALAAFGNSEWKEVLRRTAAVPGGSADGPRALYLAGETHLIIAAPKEAQRAFEKALSARPESVPLLVGCSRAALALGEDAAACDYARAGSSGVRSRHDQGRREPR